MRRGFELFQSVDPQVVMQPLGLNRPDSWNRLEKQDGIDLAAQVFEHRQTAGFDQTADGDRQLVADGGNPLQTFDPFARVQIGHGSARPAIAIAPCRYAFTRNGLAP